MAEFTTFKIGGKARFMITASTEEEVLKGYKFAEENDLKIFILGGGSNVLIADEGFYGVVLQIALKGIEFREKGMVKAQAGEDWDEFVQLCIEQNLAGIECLSGIPGFVGGTPVQNVGAYGQEISETIVRVRVFDRNSKEILELTNEECGFEYRKSIFNSTHKDRFIVLSVNYRLEENGQPKIIYKDLQEYFGQRKPTLKETREAVRQIRAKKAMLVRQGGPDAQSAGSFFKNPVVSDKKFCEIIEVAKKSGLDQVPNFHADDNHVKIPAAWLIEKSGFYKGFRKGNAGLSTRHTLALINLGQATAGEILALKDEIQSKVKETFGIELIPEPVFIGFD